jgi:hypothetical protein
MVVRPLLPCESRLLPVLWPVHSERRERAFFFNEFVKKLYVGIEIGLDARFFNDNLIRHSQTQENL